MNENPTQAKQVDKKNEQRKKKRNGQVSGVSIPYIPQINNQLKKYSHKTTSLSTAL